MTDLAKPFPERLALLAGAGRLPRLIAHAALERGAKLLVLTPEDDRAGYDGAEVHAITLGQVGGILSKIEAFGARHLVMAGKIHRPDFARLKLDGAGLKALPAILAAATKGDDALIGAVVKIFEARGITILAPESVIEDLLPRAGTLTSQVPSPEDEADILKALSIAKAIGGLDIGQGAVVAQGLVLAVEAAEGTDAMLARVGQLPRALRGDGTKRLGVLAKVAKPGQERRVDLPAVGLATIERAAEAGLAGVVVEAGASLIIERDQVIARADALGLFLAARQVKT